MSAPWKILTVQLLSGDVLSIPVDIQDTNLNLYETIRDALPESLGKVYLPQLNLMEDGKWIPMTKDPVRVNEEKTYRLFIDPFRYRIHLFRRKMKPFACEPLNGRDGRHLGRAILLTVNRIGQKKDQTDILEGTNFCCPESVRVPSGEELAFEEWVLYDETQQTYRDLKGVENYRSIRETYAISVINMPNKKHHNRKEIIRYFIGRFKKQFGPSLSSLQSLCQELNDALSHYEDVCSHLTGEEDDIDYYRGYDAWEDEYDYAQI